MPGIVAPQSGEAARERAASAPEIAEFIDADGEPMFVVRHVPARAAHAAVLICSPLLAELAKNYRREVALARGLSARGIATVRFHYRGTGHSGGESQDVTAESLRADAARARQFLAQRIGTDLTVGVLGTRLGAVAATALAAGDPAMPVVLWEPVISAPRYFRGVLRAGIVRDLKEGVANGKPSSLDTIRQVGSVDVLGYQVTHGLVTSLLDFQPAAALAAPGRPILLVSFGPAARADARDQDAMLAALQRGGAEVSVEEADLDESWWFGGGAGQAARARAGSHGVVERTATWLEGALSKTRGVCA